jgi:hypothetical protein
VPQEQWQEIGVNAEIVLISRSTRDRERSEAPDQIARHGKLEARVMQLHDWSRYGVQNADNDHLEVNLIFSAEHYPDLS